MRLRILLSVLWSTAVVAIALRETFSVDPWHMFSEDGGTLFFRWSTHLVPSASSPFGDYVLEFQLLRFLLVLLAPVALLWLVELFSTALKHRRPTREPRAGSY